MESGCLTPRLEVVFRTHPQRTRNDAMQGILDEILAHKRREISDWLAHPLPKVETPELPRRDLRLKRSPNEALRLIAEIKLRSPSAGPLSTVLSVAERARAYEAAGASAVSVLCDERYFDGSYAHLSEVKRACSLPVLCKEFVIDEVQLDRAAVFGADAVLLIVRCLSQPDLRRLIAGAEARTLTPLVEVYTEEECERALAAGAMVVGVNARDLNTLEMNTDRARRALNRLPSDVTAVHLSGIKSAEGVRELRGTRADAALIGETLMRCDDPTELLSQLSLAAEG